jgi:hypothetical protein
VGQGTDFHVSLDFFHQICIQINSFALFCTSIIKFSILLLIFFEQTKPEEVKEKICTAARKGMVRFLLFSSFQFSTVSEKVIRKPIWSDEENSQKLNNLSILRMPRARWLQF